MKNFDIKLFTYNNKIYIKLEYLHIKLKVLRYLQV